jgi:iron complex transport system ATP-binding protein
MRLSAENMGFRYGETPVLESVSLCVEPGRILGLLGANGAGKSTVLRVLNGGLPLDSGRVLLDDRSLSTMTAREIARAVATVPQNPGARFGFSIREVVGMGRRPHHSLVSALGKTDRDAIDQALGECGLQELADRPITELSGGELQLTFVARALAQQSHVLLLDEATSNLDISHTGEILSIIKRRAQEGMAVVSVVHDLNTAISFCDTIAFLVEGKLLGPGTPREMMTPETLSSVYGVPPGRVHIHQKPFFVECRLGDA